MRDFFRSKLFLFTLIVLLLSGGLLLASAVRRGDALFLSRAVNVVVAPFQKAGSAVSGFFGGVSESIYETDRLKKENEELRDRVSELEEELRAMEYAEEENKSLRELLDLKAKNRSFTFEPAEIIGLSSESWDRTLTVDKGEREGVSLSDCVVTGQGMVGFVSEVSYTSCKITTLVDPAMQCGAVVSRSRVAAVAEGDFSLMEDGFLKLSYLKTDADVLTGDTVETSGLGGLFPKGILIGRVDRIQTESHGISNYAIIEPAVDLDDLKKVFIITDFTVEG